MLHLIGNISKIMSKGDFEYVYLGDDKACQVVGEGKVLTKLQNGNQWVLNHVRHIVDLRRKLISTG